MFSTVELPLWLLILILAFATVTALSHFLLPSVRWFFRRRMERVVARLNERLHRPIAPFKLLGRQDMIQRLIYDPAVVEAVAADAAETGVREDVSFQKARRYAREIVPSFSATAYFGFGIRAARLFSRAFYRIQMGKIDPSVSDVIRSESTVIFVMNHRSNMDYVLVTYLASESSALSYAVGEWAQVWPLSRLIRSMGAYFIRRRSQNPLYRRVLARYVQMATKAGVAQAVFPEGGLSRDGTVGDPKLGLLHYILMDFDPEKDRDVVFVPVALNYDRVIEDRVLIAAGEDSVNRFRFRWRDAFRYFVKHLFQRLSGRFVRFGNAAVSFGEPLSLSDFLKGKQGDQTRAIGRELVARIKVNVPVVPVPLVAHLILQHSAGLPRDELEDAVETLTKKLRCNGASIAFREEKSAKETEAAINHLLSRQILQEQNGRISPVSGRENFLRYYAASIDQLLRVQIQSERS